MKLAEEKNYLLTELRILDLADEKASYCSKLLADMGADVIKVEKPGGDGSRWIGPFLQNSPHPERSLFFTYHNSNKRGVTLNLEHPDGREIFLKLLKTTDIIVETFPPGYLNELNLGFEALFTINPKLIMVSVTGFGQEGPRSHYKSCDLVASAFGGQMYVSGSPATPPLKAYGEQSYYTASLFAAIAILLALRKRAHSGKGSHIDISLQEAVVSTLEHVMIRYFYEKIIPKRQGSLHWNHSFGIFPCKDGHILLTPLQHWETLVEWMAQDGMAEDLQEEKWEDEDYRQRYFDHIVEVLQRWTLTQTTHKLFELGQLMRFPWSPVNSLREVLESPQLKARQFFRDPNHPLLEESIQYPGVPYRFSRSSLSRWKRAPFIGEDNMQIYAAELGLAEEEIRRLSSIRVI